MLDFHMIKQSVRSFTIILVVFIALNSIIAPSLGDSPGLDQSSIIAIDISSNHNLALMSNGTVWAWGNNIEGQCGIDITNDTRFITRPVQVSGISDVKAIASGESFSLALKNDGTVWAWGSNLYGEIGIGVPATRTSADSYPHPTQVRGLSNVIAIDAGDKYALALENDGTVWAWGQHCEGTLGDGQPIDRFDDSYFSSPTRIRALENIKSIYAGPVNAMALTKDGQLWAWGHGSPILGERQLKSAINDNSTPDVLPFMAGIKSVTMGTGHAVILMDNGTVWIWGNNWRGKLGNGSVHYNDMSAVEVSYTPIMVPGLTNVMAIAAGIEHTVALKDDGTVWAWGGNGYGQIGDGTKEDRNKPVQLLLSNIAMISAGGQNTATIDRDGVLRMCGANTYGQLGNGSSGNELYDSSLQIINLGLIAQEPDVSSSNVSKEDNSGVSSQNPLINNIMKIAALLVIIAIIGAGILFYIKKK
jgi:alpha-tubulin suppressor-like RCC1 family protein